jgi:Primase X
MSKNQVQRDVKQLKEAVDGLDFIMELFEVPRFPRTITTGATSRRQYTVNSREEAITYFEAALYEDCYINAYLNYEQMVGEGWRTTPVPKPVPNHIIIDLDRSTFNSDQEFEAAITTTLQNIKNKENFTGITSEYPVVIWSGNGVHVHVSLPGFTTPLEDIVEFAPFAMDGGGKNKENYLSDKFLRWAERKLSNGMADQHHNPSIKSALFRVPGTYNIKAKEAGKDPRVKVMQGFEHINKLIGKRYGLPDFATDKHESRPKQSFLNDFLGFLIQERIDDKVEKLQRRKYDHHLIQVGGNSSKNEIPWIDKLLQTGIGDERKNLIFWVLAPYLITVRDIEYDKAYHIIEAWLERCDQIRSLEPDWNSFRYRIRYCLDNAEDQERKPIRFETFKEYYPDIYRELGLGGGGFFTSFHVE